MSPTVYFGLALTPQILPVRLQGQGARLRDGHQGMNVTMCLPEVREQGTQLFEASGYATLVHAVLLSNVLNSPCARASACWSREKDQALQLENHGDRGNYQQTKTPTLSGPHDN